MKSELLDREVLCIYDIRTIQAYIFSSNNNIDIMGAGEFVKNIHLEALEYAIRHLPQGLSEEEYSLEEWDRPDYVPYFYEPKIKVQLVTIGGGNAFMLFRTGALARDVNKIYARYVLEESYSLQVAVAATSRTENFARDINTLYNELARIKNTQPFYHPLGTLPIVEKEECTGNPVCGGDEKTGQRISMETMRKRQRARLGIREDALSNMSEIGKYHRTLAYIHMDGNGFGLAIGKIFAQIQDYEEGIAARRKLNANITNQYLASLDGAEEKLKVAMLKDGIASDRFYQYYQRLNVGGDDINVVCAPQYAFLLVSYFVTIVSEKYIWKDDIIGGIKFSVCAGIALVNSSIEYFQGYQLAQQCCQEAKKEAKKAVNSVNGGIGNWLDYQIINDRRLEDISTMRARDFSSNGFDLCLRPYCLDREREGTFNHISHLGELLAAFEKYLPATLRWRLLNSISESPAGAHMALERIMLEMRDEDRELLEKDFLPILGDELAKVEGREVLCSHWYDALELSSMSDWCRFGNRTTLNLI